MDTIIICMCLLTLIIKAICPPPIGPMAFVIITLVVLKSIDVGNSIQ